MDAMKIENFFGSGRLELRRPSKHEKYDEVLSIVDVVMFRTVMAVWCAFAICRVTSYENIVQTAVGNQLYWEKMQQIRRFQSSEHVLPCLCHQSSCCLASLTRSF